MVVAARPPATARLPGCFGTLAASVRVVEKLAEGHFIDASRYTADRRPAVGRPDQLAYADMLLARRRRGQGAGRDLLADAVLTADALGIGASWRGGRGIPCRPGRRGRAAPGRAAA